MYHRGRLQYDTDRRRRLFTIILKMTKHQKSPNINCASSRKRTLSEFVVIAMPQDWYATVADVADRLAYTAKSSYAHIHDSLSDLTSGIDSAVFHATGPTKLFAPAPPPPSQWETISAWIVENKYAIAALTGVTGAGAYIVYKQQVRKHKKRRAARTGNASRKEGSLSLLTIEC